jgi:dTDP-4-dehydrorhamnose reductase
MKNILVTGANGQLGSTLKKLARQNETFAWSFIDIHDLDLTNRQLVEKYLYQNHTDYIINCAAYTAVDKAEDQPEDAFLANADIPEILGNYCLGKSIRLIHISTDYIYNGKSFTPHKEDEDPAPVSIYAQSKLQGERILWGNTNAIIIRTSWLYCELGNNFLCNMLRLGRERKEINMVFDQVGTPTYAGDLASVLAYIITYSEKEEYLPGIYNYSNEGVCSWYDFAWEIMRLAEINCAIKPILTRNYPLPAQRPEYSVLDKSKIKNTFGIDIPYWKESLIKAMAILEKK